MLEDVARRLAENITSDAPAGWTEAVLSSLIDRGSISTSRRYSASGKPVVPLRIPSSFSELGGVREEVRRVLGWEKASVEIRCSSTGDYRLVVFTDAVTSRRGVGSGFLVVLDPDYRLPQPGQFQSAGTAPPAGDPQLAVERFREYLQKRAGILGHAEQLPPPVSEADLDDVERRIGLRLPADLRALYLVANGDAVGHEPRYLFGGNTWLRLESLVALHADHRERAWFGWGLEWDGVVFDADPAETVRRCGGHPGWVPFASGEDGNYLAVDLAPAVNGRPGQVIGMGRDHDKGPSYFADSVTSLLGRYLSLLDQGAYETYDGHIALRPPAGGPSPMTVVGQSIPDPAPAPLQAIHINNAAGPVELDRLSASPNLRLLHLNRCATTDLAPIAALPVESVRVTLDGGDLTPIQGHLHLSSLELGTTAAVDITPLTTAPNLRGLDLSRAGVSDLTVLAEMPDLRYLALNARQWDTLLDNGNTPPALAAACLAGEDASLDQALAWAARLGLDTKDALGVTGKL